MSSVLKRHQKISEMEFYRKSAEFRDKITTALMKETYVPKRMRSVFTFPVIALADQLMEQIVIANSIYPYTPEKLQARKAAQQTAIRTCELLWDKLNWYVRYRWKAEVTADTPLPGDLEECLVLLDMAETRLQEWHHKAKLVDYRAQKPEVTGS